MKKTDWLGLVFFTGLVTLLIVFINPFVAAVKSYPILMGFAKVAVLATFGECLKSRLKTGRWRITHPVQRFVVWGMFGIWFTWVFPLFSTGVEGLISKDLWFSFLEALSKSFWINVFSGFAPFMMLVHEYFNKLIEKQGFVGGEEFFKKLDRGAWIPSFEKWTCVPMTIIWFWVPAHTFTFMLPGHFRILCAAFLSVALGFLLTLPAVKKEN